MTTEEDFQAMLDLNPEDHQTRLIFADWLQDRDDPRAEGYRALGMKRLFPHWWHVAENWQWSDTVTGQPYGSHLPEAWYSRLCPPAFYPTRREADDRAALAFAKLPVARRNELLKVIPCPV